jgi:biotin operon repressor
MKLEKGSHMWTKADIKKVATLWETSTITEIATAIGINRPQLMYMLRQMRNAGFDIPKKHKTGYIQILLEECKREMK